MFLVLILKRSANIVEIREQKRSQFPGAKSQGHVPAGNMLLSMCFVAEWRCNAHRHTGINLNVQSAQKQTADSTTPPCSSLFLSRASFLRRHRLQRAKSPARFELCTWGRVAGCFRSRWNLKLDKIFALLFGHMCLVPESVITRCVLSVSLPCVCGGDARSWRRP